MDSDAPFGEHLDVASSDTSLTPEAGAAASEPVSHRLVSVGWGAELHAGLARDSGVFRVVCPFIKERVLADLLDHHDPADVLMVTRFRLADFCAGVSDISALRRVLAAGGRVRGVKGLHAKVYVFGGSRAAVTSANLTSPGMRGNHEFGCVAEGSEFVAACRHYFDELWRAAARDLLPEQLDEWEAEVETFLNTGGRPGSPLQLPDHGAQVAAELTDSGDGSDEPAEGWPAESGDAFVKFFGEGSNRVAWSFSVLEEVERAGCHWACTYPASKRPRSVAEGDTMFVGRLVKDPPDTLIFGRAIGRAHVPGRDEATAPEIELRPFKTKWRHYIRVHHAEFVAGELRNGVSLNALMDALGSDAFRTTQLNARANNGSNVNPRKAFMQQASVRLTEQAAAWLTSRLQEAFAVHGRLPASDLAELDWPENP